VYNAIAPAIVPAVASATSTLRLGKTIDFTTGAFPAYATFTRASSGTYTNSSTVLSTASTDVPRFDYDPSTSSANGLLIEAGVTNYFRNNTMVGGVAGSSGTLPTNWNGGSPASVTRTLSYGTENGLSYIDINYSGTTSTTGTQMYLDGISVASGAASGQVWSASCYSKLSGGSLTNVSNVTLNIVEYNSGSSLTSSGVALNTGTSSIATQRSTVTRTLNNASTNQVGTRLDFVWTSGAAINITIRLAGIQLEQSSYASSLILTSNSTVTRSGDFATISTLASFGFNPTWGTFVMEYSLPYVGSANQTLLQVDDGEVGTAIIISIVAGNIIPNNRIAFSNNNIVGPIITPNVIHKFAYAYKAGANALCSDGGTVYTGTAAVPTGLTTMRLGSRITDFNFGGWIRKVSYYPSALSSSQLIALTQ